jgi:hypothetical protein
MEDLKKKLADDMAADEKARAEFNISDHFVPSAGLILLEGEAVPDKKGGILLTEAQKHRIEMGKEDISGKPRTYKVLDSGKEALKRLQESDIIVGDTVYIQADWVTTLTFYGKKFYLLYAGDIIGKVPTKREPLITYSFAELNLAEISVGPNSDTIESPKH